MNLPPDVTIVEVGPRDGFQVEARPIPTDLKVEIVEGLIAAGVRQIQVTSFVHPERVPQMADAEALCARLQQRGDVIFSALVLNERGVERARAAGLRYVDVSVSTSDAHSRRNANLPLDEATDRILEMIRAARDAGMRVRAGLQCVWGCAYEGAVPALRVLRMAERILGEGVDALSLADSTGMGNPRSVARILAQLRPLTGNVPVVLHLHDTRGMGLANVLAAVESGITHFDTALGGMGGCPFIPGASGNIATEDTVNMLENMGVMTGIDVHGVAACSRRMERFLERTLPGKLHRILEVDDATGGTRAPSAPANRGAAQAEFVAHTR